ncbi:MAG TPA: Gfo/Idh/MocA family oxidoreductase [bacterium]|mgnify:CR=1 FL=1|nr:Gfo/Idh/MocA family oxidoreductase [bacterium]
MKKIFYLYDAGHISEKVRLDVEKIFTSDGRFSFEMDSDTKILCSLKDKDYDSLIVFVSEEKKLTEKEQNGIIDYVKSGGGIVFINSSIECILKNPEIKRTSGVNAVEDKGIQQFSVFIDDNNHYITTRFPSEFVLTDRFYYTRVNSSKIIFSTPWCNEKSSIVCASEYGNGRFVFISPGGCIYTWKNFNFSKIVLRSIAWCCGEKQKEKIINCGLIGYGPMFGMGKGHATWIDSTTGMKTIAMCDTNPERVNAAKQELPNLKGYFTTPDDMLKMKEIDLVVGIVPHNVHADIALKAFDYGKHVILEKPFCINIKEANKLIETAKQKNLMLSVFHNRRWDGDYIIIKDIIEKGLIGEIFHIECFIGSFSHPRYWWRSDKKISGGIMHDWGAHFIDWILNLIPSKITGIYGDFQKRVWFSVSNEDHGQAIIRFENGTTADFMISSISAISRPKWKIFGTKGAIEIFWESADKVNLVSYASGIKQESTVMVTIPRYGSTEYYRNIADHLLMNEELIVKPEQSRRVIGVVEAAEQSSKTGKIVAAFENCE